MNNDWNGPMPGNGRVSDCCGAEAVDSQTGTSSVASRFGVAVGQHFLMCFACGRKCRPVDSVGGRELNYEDPCVCNHGLGWHNHLDNPRCVFWGCECTEFRHPKPVDSVGGMDYMAIPNSVPIPKDATQNKPAAAPEGWEHQFDLLLKDYADNVNYCGDPMRTKGTTEQILKSFIDAELSKARREERESITNDVRGIWTDFDGPCDACRLFSKIIARLERGTGETPDA